MVMVVGHCPFLGRASHTFGYCLILPDNVVYYEEKKEIKN